MSHRLMYHVNEISENKPVVLTANLTGKCNLRCSFCFQDNHPRKDLDIEIIKKVVESMPSLKAVELGMGEPTMHPQLEEIINWLKDRGLSVGFGSNGLNLYKINLEVLAKLSWIVLGITYYVEKRRLVDYTWLPCPYAFIYVIHEQTPGDAEELAMFLKTQYNLNKKRLRYFDVRLDLRDPDNKRARKLFLDLKNKLKYTKLRFVDSAEKFKPYKGRCYSANLKPFLNNDGNIYACCIDMKDGDFNKDRFICTWDRIKEDYFNLAMFVDCKACSRIEKHNIISKYLEDVDMDFIF